MAIPTSLECVGRMGVEIVGVDIDGLQSLWLRLPLGVEVIADFDDVVVTIVDDDTVDDVDGN